MQHRTTDLNRTSDPDAKGIVEAGSAKVYLNNYGETIRESQHKASDTEEANGSA